jgi:hypothetical protein
MYNRFKNSNVSKLGFQSVNHSGLSPMMQSGLSSAIPIWELLKMTEEEYIAKYQTSVVDSSNNTTE